MYPSSLTYTGPGDVVSGAQIWFGMRAYNNTLANSGASTTAVADLRGSTSGSCTLYLKGDGTGNIDVTTSGPGAVGHQCIGGATTFCTSTNASCLISKWYDQSGNVNPALQSTAADQPTLTFSGLGGQPVVTSPGSPIFMETNTTISSHAQPNTYVAVTKNTAASTQQSIVASDANTGTNLALLEFDDGAANVANVYAGTTAVAGTAAVSTWFSLIGLTNGASSVIYVNGSGTSGNAGTRPLVNLVSIFNYQAGNTFYLVGSIAETGIWETGFSAGQAGNMSSNQRAYWGF